MSLTALLWTFAYIAVAICIGLLIMWGIRWLGVPTEPAKYLAIITWVVIGVICVMRLISLLGPM